MSDFLFDLSTPRLSIHPFPPAPGCTQVCRYGRWIRVPAGQRILNEWESRSRVCLLVEGLAGLHTNYHGVEDVGRLLYSGDMFDFGLLNIFGEPGPARDTFTGAGRAVCAPFFPAVCQRLRLRHYAHCQHEWDQGSRVSA